MDFLKKIGTAIWQTVFGAKTSRAPQRRPRKSLRSPRPGKGRSPKPGRRPAVPIRGRNSKTRRPSVPQMQKGPQHFEKTKKNPPPAIREKGQELRVGRITHFFPQVNAAAIMIDGSALSVGDEIVIRTSKKPLKMKVQSLQINRLPVHAASKGTEVGLLVKQRVHEGDEVYKIV